MGVLSLFLLGFLAGIAFSLAVTLLIVLKLTNIYQGTNLPPPVIQRQFSVSHLPKILSEFYKKKERSTPEPTSAALNTLLMFLFQELKHSDRMRSWFQRKVEVELNELKHKAALRVVVRDLKLISFDLGSSLPIIDVISVETTPPLDQEGCDTLQCIDAVLDLTYSGGISLSLEGLLSFDRTLLFDCKILSLSGKARLQFSRHPYTNWSFAFIQDPAIDIDLKTNINGRNIPQLIIPIITNQIKRVIRQKHTLPAYKMRVKPLFGGINYTSLSADDAKYNTTSQTRQQQHRYNLTVNLISGSRLVMDKAGCDGLFAVICLDTERYSPQLPYREEIITVTIEGDHRERIKDLSIKQGRHSLIRRDVVWVHKVKSGSAADRALLVKGQVITHINNTLLTSLLTMAKIRDLLTDPKQLSVELTVATYLPILPRAKSSSNIHSSARGDNLVTGSDVILTNSTEDNYVEINTVTTPAKSINRSSSTGNLRAAHSADSSTKLTESRSEMRSSVTSECILNSTTGSKSVSKSVQMSPDPEFDERFQLSVDTEHLYLNVVLFAKYTSSLSPHAADRDALIGYSSLSLNDILLRCQNSTQNETLVRVSLSAPPDVDLITAPPGARSVDLSRCHGDITMILSTTTDEWEDPNADPDYDEFTNIELPEQTSSREGSPQRSSQGHQRSHDFSDKSFSQAVRCTYCLKKIWMKRALQCTICNIIIHKRCEPLCQTDTRCIRETPTGTDETDLHTGEDNYSRLTRARASLSSKGRSILSYPKRAAHVGASFVQQKLRRRRGSSKSDLTDSNEVTVLKIPSGNQLYSSSESDTEISDLAGSSPGGISLTVQSAAETEDHSDNQSGDVRYRSSAPSNGSPTPSSSSSSEEDEEIEGRRMRGFHQTKGAVRRYEGAAAASGDQNDEEAITAAKRMGKELYASLGVEERKLKLEATVERLQQEIEMVSAIRDEHQKSLKNFSTTAQKEAILSRIEKANDKLQALAVLSLHYCSGLQDCAEQQENKSVTSSVGTSGGTSGGSSVGTSGGTSVGTSGGASTAVTQIPDINITQPSDNSLNNSDTHTLMSETVRLSSSPANHSHIQRDGSSDSSDWQNISEAEIE